MNKYDRFVLLLGPALYQKLLQYGVLNIDTVWDHMMRHLAYESAYGDSSVARNQHNYGGYGWNGKTYTTFKDDDAFLNAYVKLMTNRYKDAVNSSNITDYATNLKKKGYFEDDLNHYMGQLAGMKTLSKAAAAHRTANPDLYTFVDPVEQRPQLIRELLNQPYIQPADNTRVVNNYPKWLDNSLRLKQATEHAFEQAAIATGELQPPTVASLFDTHKQALNYDMLKLAGMILDDDDDFYKQMMYQLSNKFTLPKFENGKDESWLDLYDKDAIVDDLMNQYKQSENFKSDLYKSFEKTRAYKKAYKSSQWYNDNKMAESLGMSTDYDNIPEFTEQFDEWRNTKKGIRRENKVLNKQFKNYTANINDIFDSIRYVDDYYKQSGIIPRRNERHPNLHFKYGYVEGQSNYKDNDITFGMDFPQEYGGAYGTAAHEYAHYVDPYLLTQTPPLNHSTLYDSRNPDPYNTDAFDVHDNKYSENYADLVGARALMYKYGIWDSRNGGEIPIRAIQKFRKKYGNQSRLFRMYDDDIIGQMYNTIAYNPTFNINRPNIS